MDSALKDTIVAIVQEIPRNNLFDTHAVIEQLEDNHELLYKEFIGDLQGQDLNTPHSEISRAVRDSKLVEQRDEKSYSRTVNGTYRSVTCWLRK